MNCAAVPASSEILIERIKKRAPISDEDLAHRLNSMRHEVSQGAGCTYQLETVDGRPELTADRIEELLAAFEKGKSGAGQKGTKPEMSC